MKVIFPSYRWTYRIFSSFISILILFGCTPAPISSVTRTPDIETIDEFFARCPTAEEIAHVNADLTLNFEYDPTAPTLACKSSLGSADLSPLQKRAYQTIYVMHLLNFSQPLPWTDKQLYDWFTAAIRGIRFVNGGLSHCCEPENIIVIALNQNSLLLKTDHWIISGANLGLMNTTLLYTHEARHNEGFQHNCTTRNGDDNTLAEMGAWAIQHYVALYIAQYSNHAFLTAPDTDANAYRLAALQEAETTYLTRFCEEIYTQPTLTLVP